LQGHRASGTHNASTSWPVGCQVLKSEKFNSKSGGRTPFSGGVLLEAHFEWESVLDFQGEDGPVPQGLDLGEQVAHLFLECEILLGGLGTRAVLGAEFHFPNDAGLGFQNRLTVTDDKPLDAAEVEALHQADELLFLLGEVAFGCGHCSAS